MHTITLNTGAPQGCELSPLLFSLYTYDCNPTHDSNTISQFESQNHKRVILQIKGGEPGELEPRKQPCSQPKENKRYWNITATIPSASAVKESIITPCITAWFSGPPSKQLGGSSPPYRTCTLNGHFFYFVYLYNLVYVYTVYISRLFFYIVSYLSSTV